MEKETITKLLLSEDEHIKKMHQIVLDSVKEEELISSRIYATGEKTSTIERLSDKVAEFGGSWKFIICFFMMMLIWILINIYFLKSKPFDPYPFILLNLILSCIAALQAPFIMMSQNRKEDKDRKRSENDYVINLKAEIEIRNLHQKLDLLMAEQMRSLFEIQKAQMEIMDDIKENLVNITR
jgi:uncharacterized membrane protein